MEHRTWPLLRASRQECYPLLTLLASKALQMYCDDSLLAASSKQSPARPTMTVLIFIDVHQPRSKSAGDSPPGRGASLISAMFGLTVRSDIRSGPHSSFLRPSSERPHQHRTCPPTTHVPQQTFAPSNLIVKLLTMTSEDAYEVSDVFQCCACCSCVLTHMFLVHLVHADLLYGLVNTITFFSVCLGSAGLTA